MKICQKFHFSKASEACLLGRIIFSKHFLSMLCMWKMLLKIQDIFWHNLQHHTTHIRDLAAAESNFWRFLENNIREGQKFEFKISPFWRFFQKFSTSKCRRITGNNSKNVEKTCVRCARHSLIQRTLNQSHTMRTNWKRGFYIYVSQFSSSQFLHLRITTFIYKCIHRPSWIETYVHAYRHLNTQIFLHSFTNHTETYIHTPKT